MAHYQVKITIQATRLPDPIPVPVHDPGKDPIGEMVGVMREALTPIRGAFFPGAFRESGLTMGKEIEIQAESFEDLARAIGQFDALAEQIECSNPVK